jgi:hypothetical protein
MLLPRLGILLVVAALLSGAMAFWLGKQYPFVLASEAARRSVEVTQEQLTELKGATFQSNLIAFAAFGAVAVAAILALIPRTGRDRPDFRLVLGGLLAGGFAGLAAGWLGHWFEASPSIHIQDTMIYMVARSSLMFAPLALVVGILAGIGSMQPASQSLVGAILGALVGGVVAAAIYAVVMGVATPLEARDKVLPVDFSNRLLFMLAAIACMGAGVLVALKERPRPIAS